MSTRFLLAFLAYVLPTFPIGYLWHLAVFKDHYEALQVYRADVIIPFGLAAMAIQGLVWTFVYWRLFAGESVLRGAVKFAAVAAPLAWSFMVIAVAAKHRMASVSGFFLIETGFIALHYLVVSPLIALAFARPARAERDQPPGRLA
ncbi:MAG: hypothetical protein C3F17_01260 [Bradyrhizobiaceae bacterium]|nr:MAG: hypothetical protein C3F17_01260 [Bradyrhizobiaceae bacterium]